jgi:guanyl-specific ribonuclease Sa
VNSGRRVTLALVGLVALVLVGWGVREVATSSSTPSSSSATASTGRTSVTSQPGFQTKPLSALPPEATTTWKLIQSNGPFPYPRNDGVVFDNREKRLPGKPSGYYHEYTVPTPGSPDRGTRRLITGSSHEVYYTGDHYDTFVLVDTGR